MAQTVTAPLERQFGQMPGLSRMSSTSAAGVSIVTLQFGLGLALDVAEQQVQAAINAGGLAAAGRPAGAAGLRQGEPGRRAGADAGHHLRHAAADRGAQHRRHAARAEDQPGQRRRPGHAVRRPAAGRAHPGRQPRAGLAGPDAGQRAHHHRSANANAAKGSIDGATRSYTINSNDQLLTAKDYGSLVVAFRNGAPVRLSDVATVVESAENVKLGAWANTAARPSS
jgi:multidrug efflux pump